jgi:hypothetical protein
VPNARVDSSGAARKGSQRQVQLYVNRHTKALDNSILDALPDLAALSPRLRWVSPLADKEYREYQDLDFLKALEIEHCGPILRASWPSGGPVWDALAIVEIPGVVWRGVLLAEGKSYPGELESAGCGAGAKSRSRIEIALAEAAASIHAVHSAEWINALYQSGNRLAHLYVLREKCNVPAWLVNLCFCGDPHRQTTRETWRTALKDVKRRLGIGDAGIPHAADVLLDAVP